jgi:hypothetical protein
MPSDAQKNAGWLLPEQIADHELICVSLKIPNVREYRAAFLGALYSLTKWFNWDKSYEPGDTRASQAAHYWRELLYEYLEIGACGRDSSCLEIPLYDPRIEWAPNDPFKTPDLVPDGYLLPPWYIAPDVNLTGAKKGDIATDLLRITAIAGWATQYDLPRLRIRVNGIGVIQVYFVNFRQGGAAQIQTDGDLLSIRIVDLWRDELTVPPETQDVIVIERRFETEGEHFLDISAYPFVNPSTIPFGFGFGIRKIVLCGFDVNPCPECPDCPDCPETPCDDCDDCGNTPNCDDCGDC